ncbi:T9SS type A sorting domain-containing protein [Niastella caeni]|uniref:T9SS type A sorting domain-containing protein n=1 Tax=Niastella caeni TaxID=2569763 RepID=A0A4S8I062_9BACT|nr:T9SS type A sorting domain-containing protein [Niastella caeni]THU41387.1 T9SS type A sorting domain-containing protein [Niastella caeni]
MKIRISERLPFLLLLASTSWVQAQVTSPIIKAKFGVDADVQNNWFNNGAYTIENNDDWYYRNGSSSSSVFVIDTTGAGTITAQYASGIGLTTPFYRKMRYPAYTQLDGTKTLIDAVFVRDYHDIDTTVFASGSNKNGMSPADWTCPDAQGVPNKNDILDAFIHIRREGPTLSIADTLWMFGGLVLEATNGNRYFDFELYQTDIFYTRSTRSFTGYGPDAGHTSWKFDASGNVTQAGDIIFSADYGSSTLSSIEARIWIDEASMAITPVAFDWTGSFEGADNAAQYGYAGIQPKTGDPFYFGTANATTTWAGPFKLVRANNAVLTSYQANQFMEFGVNLTVLGLNPQTLMGVTACGIPFSKVLIKTRASTSFNAELKDFIGPFDLFLPPRATAAADIPMYCGTTGISEIEVTNPYATSYYSWTTTDGHIIGATNGTSVTVDQAGTYVVTQSLDNGCPAFSTDTVVIAYDPNCTVLSNNEVSFKGAFKNSLVQLDWSVTNNQDIKYFTIERSIDGIHFTLADTVNNQGITPGYVTYTTTDNANSLRSSYVYYRIKISVRNGSVQYSKVIRVAITAGNEYNITLQPNPVRDHLRINIHSDADRDVDVLVYNVTGQLVRSMNTRAKKGDDAITLTDFRGWAKGVYTVKVLSGKHVYVDRMVLVK